MSLLIATPMYGGMCTSGYFQSCLNLRSGLLEAGLPHDWHIVANESLIPRARNECVRVFLETDYAALLFVDADIEFTEADVAKLWNEVQPDNPDRLMDIMAGCYRMKRLDAPYAGWVGGEQLTDLSKYRGPFQADYAGTGFMLICRSVFERMIEHLEVPYETKDGKTAHALFDTELRDGVYLSEDYLFCLRAKEMGIPVWMHPDVKLIHHGSYAYGTPD